MDLYKFTATAGQVFEVECYGRRIRSPIDPVMNLYKANGEGITGNDDSRGPDSYFRWQVPADGEYAIRIADHLNRGGPEFVYRVEFQEVKPVTDCRYSPSRTLFTVTPADLHTARQPLWNNHFRGTSEFWR